MLKSERATKILTTTPINQKIAHLCLTLMGTQLLDNTTIATEVGLMRRWISVIFKTSSRVSRAVSVEKTVVERRKLKNQLFMVKKYILIDQFPKKLKKDIPRKTSRLRSRRVWSAKLNVMALSWSKNGCLLKRSKILILRISTMSIYKAKTAEKAVERRK